jgi:hypothetical protein
MAKNRETLERWKNGRPMSRACRCKNAPSLMPQMLQEIEVHRVP